MSSFQFVTCFFTFLLHFELVNIQSFRINKRFWLFLVFILVVKIKGRAVLNTAKKYFLYKKKTSLIARSSSTSGASVA